MVIFVEARKSHYLHEHYHSNNNNTSRYNRHRNGGCYKNSGKLYEKK